MNTFQRVILLLTSLGCIFCAVIMYEQNKKLYEAELQLYKDKLGLTTALRVIDGYKDLNKGLIDRCKILQQERDECWEFAGYVDPK